MKQLSLLVLFVLVLGLSSISAQTEAISMKLPYINNHKFVPISAMQPAFTNTYFATYVGLGQTVDFRYPVFELPNGKVLSVKGDISFVDLDLNYQYQVQEWLGLYMQAKIATRVGTDVKSILSQGINTLTSFDIGWNFHLYKSEKIKLTGCFEMQKHTGNFINIWDYVKNIIDEVPEASVTSQVPLLVGATGLRFAYGINDLIGVRFDSKLSWGETYNRKKNGFRYLVSSAVDVDFNKRFDIPLGIATAVMVSTQPDLVFVENKTARSFLLKFAYTGSKDFSVGVEYSRMKIPLNFTDEIPKVENFAFIANYYF